MSRATRMLAAAGLAAGSLTAFAAASPPATALIPSPWCSARPAPCVESATHDGSPVTSSDPTFSFSLDEFDPGHYVRWNLLQSGDDELGPAAAGTWSVVMDVGTEVPRVVYGTGRNGEVVRIPDGDGSYHVTTTAEPTLVVEGCDSSSWPWTCPSTATAQATRLSAEILDWSSWEDPVQRAAFYGVDFWTNVSTTSFPPGVIYREDTGIAEMRLDLAAPHHQTDGTTVTQGHFEMVLPNDFLHENFFIPAPTTMTPASLAVAGGGPASTTSVTKASASAPMEIEVTGMTFSTRTLRVKTGTIVPTRPGDPRGTRVSATAARVSYDLSSARGARVTGYRGRCASPGGDVETGTVQGNASPVRVGGLRAGAPYTCRVQALSKAGPSPWSAAVNVPRRP